jgi:hypothetical protein
MPSRRSRISRIQILLPAYEMILLPLQRKPDRRVRCLPLAVAGERAGSTTPT